MVNILAAAVYNVGYAARILLAVYSGLVGLFVVVFLMLAALVNESMQQQVDVIDRMSVYNGIQVAGDTGQRLRWHQERHTQLLCYDDTFLKPVTFWGISVDLKFVAVSFAVLGSSIISALNYVGD